MTIKARSGAGVHSPVRAQPFTNRVYYNDHEDIPQFVDVPLDVDPMPAALACVPLGTDVRAHEIDASGLTIRLLFRL